MNRLGRPLVGISGRRIVQHIGGLHPSFQGAPAELYLSDYARSVTAAGGVPVHLPLEADVIDVIDALDAVVLSGGNDIDPDRYRGKPVPANTPIDPQRDAFETELFLRALELGKPVLGICRGAQLINVALGGTLVEDLSGEFVAHASAVHLRHHRRQSVHFSEGSLAYDLYGPSTMVNSFHHQAVKSPGAGVITTGRADDDVPEAIEVLDRPVLGVQWHPECLAGDPAFNWLIAACAQTKALLSDSIKSR